MTEETSEFLSADIISVVLFGVRMFYITELVCNISTCVSENVPPELVVEGGRCCIATRYFCQVLTAT